jgi:hypothetical protein
MQLIFTGIKVPIGALTTMPNISMADVLNTYTLLGAGLSNAYSPDPFALLRFSCSEYSQRFPKPSSSHTHHQYLEG